MESGHSLENLNFLQNVPHLSPYGSNLLLLLASSMPQWSEEIFTNFSHEPTWRWYFAMTPFEAFFLGIILTQFGVLNLFGIFPLNLSNLINGMPSGRKRRQIGEPPQRNQEIALQLLKLMKKLDPERCSFKAICELELRNNNAPQHGSAMNVTLPFGIRAVLEGLKQISKKRINGKLVLRNDDKENSLLRLPIPGINLEDDDVIAMYEEAVKVADGDSDSFEFSAGPNTFSVCKKAYPKCSVDGDEIMGYVNMVESLDDLLLV